MRTLLALWDESAEMLMITRADGQTRNVPGPAVTDGGHRVFGIETVGGQVHLLTGPRSGRKPNRRVMFNAAGAFQGRAAI